jgi:hypothetical protein
MLQRNAVFAFEEWTTSLGDLRRRLEILITTCDDMREQTKVLSIEAVEGLGSEHGARFLDAPVQNRFDF